MEDKKKLEQTIYESIVVGGFGGQGVLLTGHLLAVACMNQGLNVTDIPSYGAEMRGGTARCSVIISNRAIASPVVTEASVVIALNRPSLVKFEGLLEPGGLLLYNTSLIEEKPSRSDIKSVGIPALDISRKLGSQRAANIACLGKLLALKPQLCKPEDIEATLDIVISERNRKHNAVNKKVLHEGFDFKQDF